MFGITQDDTLLGKLFARYWNDADIYTDSYSRVLPGRISLGNFIERFYTSRLFKLELFVFRLTIGMKTTDADARALAKGADRFAVWRIEARSDDQILLCDQGGHTRSWLMVVPEGDSTRLVFGSAVMPQKTLRQKWIFKLATPFHKLYARALLRAA